MGFKKYFIFSVILIVATFGFAYGLELGEYELSLFGYSLLLPVSVWLILPISLLAVASMAHILWYGVINYFRKRAIEKDYETIIKMIKSDLLEKNEEYKFKTTEFKNLSSIISQLKIDTKENRFLSVDDELNRVVANVQDVKIGKHVTEKTFKVNENSKLADLNILNKVNEQIDFAVDVLKQGIDEILKKLNLDYVELVRVKNTKKMHRILDQEKRNENVKNSFFNKKKIDFSNKTILLFDDIITTGATLKALKKEIEKENINIKIVVFCLAAAREIRKEKGEV